MQTLSQLLGVPAGMLEDLTLAQKGGPAPGWSAVLLPPPHLLPPPAFQGWRRRTGVC